jgi:MoaD family protein
MTVRTKFFAYFRDLFGAKERPVELPEGASVGALLGSLCDTAARRSELFGEAGLRPHIVIMINGTPLSAAGGIDARLHEGDTVAIFPLMGGG